ncbi:MAG: PEP-CTERM sorting domain-containing protein [Planctomycetes bacterium]|nr:PEP-CTERM sorting domain-containing protein [Planctomycetota bacterium]
MRTSFAVTVAGVIAALATTVFGAEGSTSPYADAIGDIDPGIATAGGTLDIVGMEVSNTPTDITFKLTVNGQVNGAVLGGVDWGKFMVGIATQKTDGTMSGNGWGRPINLSYDNDPFAAQIVGMNHWLGGWVDGSSTHAGIGGGAGGAELYHYDNGGSTQAAWIKDAATYDAVAPTGFAYSVTGGAQSSVQWTVSLSRLNLVPGNVIYFDAYSSGGGNSDSAVDSLANPNVSITGWSGPYTSYATAAGGPGLNAYTISAVPEPSSMAAVGLAGAAIAGHLMRRRRSA